MTEVWGDLPPHWIVYYHVYDIEKSVEKVKELGGTICIPPTPIEDFGRFCMLNDPCGVTFSLMSRPIKKKKRMDGCCG